MAISMLEFGTHLYSRKSWMQVKLQSYLSE